MGAYGIMSGCNDGWHGDMYVYIYMYIYIYIYPHPLPRLTALPRAMGAWRGLGLQGSLRHAAQVCRIPSA